MKLLIPLVLSILVYTSLTAYCHGKPGDYLVNNEPVWKGEPKLIRTHEYGKLYEIGEG